MKIGIDISQIVYHGTGVARFTQGLVNSILDFDKKNQWLFFFSSLRRNLNQDLEKKILSRKHKLIKWKLPPTLLSFLWDDLHQFFPSSIFNPLSSSSLDWFITSDWTEPPLPKKIKKATVVHDLVYLRYPETVDEKIRRTQEKRLPWVKKESSIIFADSQATKRDLINLLQINSNRIVVNYPGISISNAIASKIEKTLKKFNLRKPFILTVGKLEPRKNIKRLVEAMKQCNNEAIDLVIVGPKGWEDLNSKFQILNVKWLGYVTNEELSSLYVSCLFFIYPSLWEGFGYPIVEAMKLGVPVTCSNTSSLKEIAGGAALVFNPQDTDDIAEKIKMMIEDEQLRKQLVAKGQERSKIFTWKNYYNKMIRVLSLRSAGGGEAISIYDNRC